jgi:hypothetical protein
VDFSLECALHAQRSAAERLAEHFADRNDDKGFEMLDELLSSQHMLLVIFNDGLRRAQRK